MLRLLIPFGLLLAIDLYFFQLIRVTSADHSARWKLFIQTVYWSINMLVYVVVIWAAYKESVPNHIRYYVFSLLLVFVIPKLFGLTFLLGEDIFRSGRGMVGFLTQSNEPFLADRRKFVSQAALTIAAIPFATMIYGMMRTAFDLQVKRTTIWYEDLPKEFDGLTIAQLSDLHSGSFASSAFISEAMDRINDLNADLIFFTGDLVNNRADEAEPYVTEFKKLKAKYGVHSILGNHDYGDYGPWNSAAEKAENFVRLKQVHADAKWNLLLNSHTVVEKNGERLAIVGVENWGASRHFPKYGDLDKAVKGIDNIPFKILLSHDPSHWDAKIRSHPQKFQLTLSGHTHGAQFGIEIPGFKWSPVQYLYKQWAGLYQDGGQNIYVNRGLGFIGYMGRIGISPEITLLELRSGKNV